MKKLVLLTYTPRDLEEDQYAAYIRETDYPAFRQNPHILDYSCWRVGENLMGTQPFTHFDLMEIDDFASFPRVMEDPAVQGNIARWTRDWSRFGADAAPGQNFQAAFAQKYWG